MRGLMKNPGRKSYEKPPPSFYSNETAAAKRAVQQPRHGFSTQGECASVIPAPDEKAEINSSVIIDALTVN
jgi:hypothetical protein